MKKLLLGAFLIIMLTGCAKVEDGFEHFSLEGVDFKEYVYYPVSGDREVYVLADMSDADENIVKTGLFYKLSENDYVLLMRLESTTQGAYNDDSIYRFQDDKLYGVMSGNESKVFEVELTRRRSKMRELKFKIKDARNEQYTPISIDYLNDTDIGLSLNVFSQGRGNIEKYSCSLNNYECSREGGETSEGEFKSQIHLNVDNRSFKVHLEDNPISRELFTNLPIDVNMRDLNGNEKYHYFGRTYISSPEEVGRIEAGDIMLYGDDCLVIFYESFETHYSYTRLGRIKNVGALKEALGSGDIKVKFTT